MRFFFWPWTVQILEQGRWQPESRQRIRSMPVSRARGIQTSSIEVRQCPAGSWGLRIGSWQWRSGRAYCNHELAYESPSCCTSGRRRNVLCTLLVSNQVVCRQEGAIFHGWQNKNTSVLPTERHRGPSGSHFVGTRPQQLVWTLSRP